jgi:hypothetical protein
MMAQASGHFLGYSMANLFPWSLWGKVRAISMATLSNGTLNYWCKRHRTLVCIPHIFSSLQPLVLLSDLAQVLLTPRRSTDGLPWSSASTSLTLLRGRTICAILDRPSADTQWRFITSSLTAWDFVLTCNSCTWGWGRQYRPIPNIVQT